MRCLTNAHLKDGHSTQKQRPKAKADISPKETDRRDKIDHENSPDSGRLWGVLGYRSRGSPAMASTARNQTLRQADDSTEWNERRGHGQENLGVDSSKVQASKEQVRKFYH